MFPEAFVKKKLIINKPQSWYQLLMTKQALNSFSLIFKHGINPSLLKIHNNKKKKKSLNAIE